MIYLVYEKTTQDSRDRVKLDQLKQNLIDFDYEIVYFNDFKVEYPKIFLLKEQLVKEKKKKDKRGKK